MVLLEFYRFLMDDISDPRVTDWPLMATPFPILAILLVYLSFVLWLGPLYMKDRKPYSLKTFMICYNIFVAAASSAVFYGLPDMSRNIHDLFSMYNIYQLLTSGFTTKLTWGCEPVDFSNDPESLSMARWVWWLMLLKMCELLDTIIFVLRKKYIQLSFLHIYHHATTVCLTWIACKYAPGGMWTFIMLPNSIVHVIMYTYYLLASLGPQMRRKLAPFKPYLTMLQLIQFLIMMVHTSQALWPSCEPNRKPLACIYMCQVIIIFYLFGDFYHKTYVKKKTV